MNETKRTLREKKFIEAYIENNGNATEAYLILNPKVKRKNASVYGIRMLEKVSIEVKEFLDKLGLNNLALSQKLKEGLEAVKKVAGLEVPDHNVRVRYLDMAFKLKADYPIDRSKLELTGKDGQPLVPPQIDFTTVLSYENCPLKDTRGCPLEKEVNLAEKERKGACVYDADR